MTTEFIERLKRENEQLRKRLAEVRLERDELAYAYLYQLPRYTMSTGEETEVFKLAKKVKENGNA